MKRFCLAAIICLAALARAHADDYSDAYRAAESSGRMLLVQVGVDVLIPVDHERFVCCSLPGDFIHSETGKRLVDYDSLDQLDGCGAFVVNFIEGRAMVVSVLPKRFCTPDGLNCVLGLPGGTLTQRTLIWAIRMHPECPRSTDCTPDFRLFAQATSQCAEQVRRCMQYHWLPLPACATSEVVAESWKENVNIVDGAIELVHSWRQSSGHWSAVSARHQAFGYDMRRGWNRKQGGPVWYGTGVFYR